MTRRLLVVAGLGALAFGLEQVLTIGPASQVLDVLLWLGAVLVVHDGLIAPVAAGAGRLLGRSARLAGAGLAVAAVLAVLALPALLSPGVPGNPTVLPRDEGLGLGILLAAAAALFAALTLARRGRSRRRRAARTGGRRPTSRR